MRIKDLPDSSRPRERFLAKGPEALSDAELLALILRIGNWQENVVEMANRLLSMYSLEKLFDCSMDELQRIGGIGPTKAMQLLAVREIGKRYNNSKNPITKITSAKDVFDYFREGLRNEKQENFIVLLLDTKNQIIKDELVTRGVLDAAIVHPREIFKPAIRNSAAKIILVHNHPSGDPNPSPEDLDITDRIKKSGEELDIRVLDHVIIGRETYWSFAEN